MSASRLPMRLPRDRWRLGVPVVALATGLLFATSASTARGTDLRATQITDLASVVRANSDRIVEAQARIAELQAEVNEGTIRAAAANQVVAQAQDRARPLEAPGGLTAVHGPGLRVELNDASDVADAKEDELNALIVHQSDVQAVVNALWAGGAEAMTIMGQRVIATSAVRCVGNTLLFNGEVYSPPFIIEAIGPADRMRSALNRSSGVALFAQAAKYLGLGYSVDGEADITAPAYTGVISLTYAEDLLR
ncbi:MAG: hypothetical protein JWN61_1159 [Pseudonocardiales bacterium]|nr:hypothetical protein [Jatrophihabitantaceae bacterium]MCW2603024.1 hypothetical protein [Pseudonocardiales bacterium]